MLDPRKNKLPILFACLLLALPAGGRLLLSDPSSEVYYTLAAVAGEELMLVDSAQVVGDVHSNGDVDLKKGSVVRGSASASGQIVGQGTVEGTSQEEAPLLALPALDVAGLSLLADRVLAGDQILTDAVIDDVLFVTGTVRLRGDLNGTGTVVAGGDILVDTTEGQSSFDLDPDSRLSLIAGNDVRIGKDRPLRAVLRAGRNVSLEKNVDFEGVIVADGQIHVKKDSIVRFLDFDQSAPVFTLETPPDGSLVPSAMPEVRIGFADDLSQVRLSSVAFVLDGEDRTAQSQITAEGLTYQPAQALPEGAHAVEISGQDHSDNPASALFSFTTDSIPPTLTLTAPLEPTVYNDPIPQIAAAFGDVGTGLDVSSLSLQIDGVELIAACSVSAAEATCQPDPLADGQHTIVGRIRDLAGNEASASRTFESVTDSGPPVVTLLEPTDGSVLAASTVRVSGTAVDDVTVVAVTVNGVEASRDGDTWAADASLQEGVNDLTVIATDGIGGQGVARARVVRDTQPPLILVEAPVDGALTNAGEALVSGQITDANGVASAEVAGNVVTLEGGRFATSVALAEDFQTLSIRAVDVAGNERVVTVGITRRTLPVVAFTSPANLSLVAAASLAVSGTLSLPGSTVAVNGLEATVTGDSFAVSGVPLSEGVNFLNAVATAANGFQSTARLTVLRDATAPRLTLEHPASGSVLYEPTVTVRGLVTDPFVAGIASPSPPAVTVNGVAATVADGFYLALDVPLTAGENLLLASADDGRGNVTEVTVPVTFAAPPRPPIRIAAGNFQTATVGSALSQPLVVELADAVGNPVSGRPVLFRVVGSNGSLEEPATGEPRRQVAVFSGADGRAAADSTLGSRAGVGSQVVEATAPGFAGVARFFATAVAGDPVRIFVDAGHQQVGIAGQDLPQALVVAVTDAGFNRLPNVAVTFRVVRGAGTFGLGEEESTRVTDADGKAAAILRLDPEEGIANNVVEARFADRPEGPLVSFSASGRVAGDPAATAVVGQVLDNSNQPVPGATLRIEGTALATQSNAQGLFRLEGAPVGTRHLLVDGATVSRAGVWPHLIFTMNLIPGRDNSLPMPIYLLPLDTANAVAVSETQGGTLGLPDIPGFSLEIAPGSVTFPDGTRQGSVSVTTVHSDKVPMTPNFGQQPRFVITIQPANAQFDPPARLSLPNVDGLAPGEVTELYSFDHDLEAFVAIGLGTVSEDGLRVESNRGVGVVKAGWHCGGNPASSGTTHDCPECQRCSGSTCVADSAQDGNECDGDFCKECQGGSCVATMTEVMVDAPPDNPNPADADFATNFSFLSNTTIQAMASLSATGDPSEIEWMVTATLGGVMNESPADRKGPTFSFVPDPPAHPAYVRGTNCGNPGNGSCARSQPLSFRIQAMYCASDDEVTITQDQIDIVRQEFLNHSRGVPGRGEFNTPAATANFSVAEIRGPSAYTIVLGNPGTLAQNVRDQFNNRIRDDVQAVAVGTMGLMPNTPVVTPGGNVQTLGALLDTAPCNGGPPGCDDQVMGNTIVAGANGIAETMASNMATNVPLRINSSWRNPERNEAVGGVINSRHQFGNAVDLDLFGAAEGKTTAQLFCILQTAADAVANGFAEHFSTQRDCNVADVTHVHVQQ